MPQATNHYLHDDWLRLSECQLKKHKIEQSDFIRQTFGPQPLFGEREQVHNTPLVEREQVHKTLLVEREHIHKTPHSSTIEREISLGPQTPVALLPNDPSPDTSAIPIVDSPTTLNPVRRSTRSNKGTYSKSKYIDEFFLANIDHHILDSKAH